jgi:hypothetical protein
MSVTVHTAATYDCDFALRRAIGAPREKTIAALTGWIARGIAGLRSLAPYAAIELILPGGSLIALLLWLYRRKRNREARKRLGATIPPSVSTFAQRLFQGSPVANVIIPRTGNMRG